MKKRKYCGWKRFCSWVLVLVLCIQLFPCTAMAADDDWSNYTAQPAGDGTEASPYRITSAEELAWFAATVNDRSGNPDAWGVLENDIDVSGHVWVAIGQYTKNKTFTYNGTFDGQNHTVSGIFINRPNYLADQIFGLFGTLSSEGKIKNLIITSSIIRGNDDVGAVCGRAYGDIENCRVSSSVTIYSSNGNCGGICGYAQDCLISDCISFATVSSRSESSQPVPAGGIVGQTGTKSTYVERCKNAGNISSGGYAGGISGYGPATIRDCYNFGTIKGSFAAGIAIGNSAGRLPIITGCGNYGRVEASFTAAGIANDAEQLSRCFNMGSIEGNATAAGIVADLSSETYYDTYGTAIVQECFNSGDISINSESLSAETEDDAYRVAGIVASGMDFSRDYVTIINCYNTGTLSAGSCSYIGGIAAELRGTMTGCYNVSQIDAGGSVGAGRRGGICGYVDETKFNIYQDGENTYEERFSFINDNYYQTGTASGAVAGADYIDYVMEQFPSKSDAMSSFGVDKGTLVSTMLRFSPYTADSSNINSGYPLLRNCMPVDSDDIFPDDPVKDFESVDGDYLYVYFPGEETSNTNLLRTANYTSPDGTVKYNTANRVLTLTNAKLEAIHANLRSPLTIVISGNCRIGDERADWDDFAPGVLLESQNYNSPVEYVIRGDDSSSLAELSGCFDVYGDLVIDGVKLTHTIEEESTQNIYVSEKLTIKNNAVINCSGATRWEGGSEDEAESSEAVQVPGTGLQAEAILIENSQVDTHGTDINADELMQINQSRISAGDIVCRPLWSDSVPSIAINNSTVNAGEIFLLFYGDIPSTPAAVSIQRSTVTANSIHSEFQSYTDDNDIEQIDKAISIVIGDGCQVINPEKWNLDLNSDEEYYNYWKELSAPDGSPVQIIAPSASSGQYAFTYNYSQSAYQNVGGSSMNTTENIKNMIISFTAMAKLAYSKNHVKYKGKTVRNYVNDGTHMEAKEYDGKIWTNSDVTYETFYQDVIGDFKIADVYDNNNKNGFYAVCFQSPYDDSYIISFRGSQGNLMAPSAILGFFGVESSNDWNTDIQFAVNNTLTTQFDDAFKFYKKIADRAKSSGSKVILTGHSLGGSLAGYISIVSGAPAITIDGAVGHIVDTTFWQDYKRVAGFHGIGSAMNVVNVTDTIGASSIADVIQATHKGVYPLVTYDPISLNKDTSGYQESVNSHQQVTYLAYDASSMGGRFRLGDKTDYYCRSDRWSNDINSFSFGQFKRKGRVQLGTRGSDKISAPSNVLIDSTIPNVQFGGNGDDALRGYTDRDYLCGGSGNNSLDGEGGGDYYIIDATNSVTQINDPCGKDTILLRGWDADDITITTRGTKICIESKGNGGSVFVNTKRSWLLPGAIAVFCSDKYGDGMVKICDNLFEHAQYSRNAKSAAQRSTPVPASASEQNAARLLVVSGSTEITVYDQAGDVMKWTDESGKEQSSFSNQESNVQYADFAYYYGEPKNGENEAQSVLYLLNESYTVRIKSDEKIQAALYQYDEEEEELVEGSMTNLVTLESGQKLKAVTVGDETGFYMEAGDVSAPLNDITSFKYPENVAFQKQSVTLKKGASEKMLLTFTPSENVLKNGTWYSSDKKVATVDEDGNVTAASTGTATILFVSGNNREAVCTVAVTDSTNNNSSGNNSTSGSGSSSGGSSLSGSSNKITIQSTPNGKVESSPANAKKGDTVTITAIPDSGYELDSITVKDGKGNHLAVTRISDTKYTFTMPASVVSVDAVFAKTENQSIQFTDVPASAYYYDAVVWGVQKGITTGASATTFNPDANCTRAQVMTFLWRAAGSPAADGSNPFTDMISDSYYSNAVQWAILNGITTGTSPTTFSPNAICTRGQAMTFLYRASGSPASAGSNAFSDVDKNAYYFDAVQWAVTKGITEGTSKTTFSPASNCTRGQVITFLYRNMKD